VATIIRDLPYFEKSTSATVHGREVPIFSYQPVLWVSVAPFADEALDPNTPRFPAVLDIGYTHNFLIRDEQLLQWAGLSPEHIREIGHIQPYGEHVPLRAANLWLHPNVPGKRDEFSGAPPFCVELPHGIGVCRSDMPRAPRLPLLGLRGLRFANLEIVIDCTRCRITIRTRWKLWPLW
jgi:hypothetical protein